MKMSYLKANLFLKVGALSLYLISLYSCKPNVNKASHESSDSVITDTTQQLISLPTDTVYTDTATTINYLFPSPDEILGEVLSTSTEFDLQNINSYKNAGKYLETKQQALNLGVYLSDLAYINLNGDKNTSLLYFKTVRDLAQKLNIYQMFDEETYQRIQKNMANTDSLNDILRNMYFATMDKLEAAKRNNIYA